MSDSFTIQMNRLHDPDYEWDNVYPLNEWTLVDYKNMFKFISEGYLVQSDDNVGFVINEEWGCDPMWEVEMIKHIDETGKETIYTFDEFFDNGHYSSDTNEDNIEMINDWCDKHNVGGGVFLSTKRKVRKIERLKAALEISEAVEKFMKDCDDIDERIKAHWREGKVIDGKWVNDVEEDEDEDNWEYSGKDGLWLNNGEPECRMCGRQGYSMACRECDICGKFNGVGGGDCECICED